jgi:hypothetical protein
MESSKPDSEDSPARDFPRDTAIVIMHHTESGVVAL